jgi:hypothetical protein
MKANRMPVPEDFGYVSKNTFEGEPGGFCIEGGEEAYDEALKLWKFMNKNGLVPEDMINDISPMHEI